MEDEEYNGGQLVVVAVVFLTITWLSVLLRMFVRIRIMKSFQLDDWLMLVSQIIFSITCILVSVGVHWGIGRHDLSLDNTRRVESRKYEALALIFYIIDVMFIKLSVAIFLLRIAVLKRYKWILYISMGLVTEFSLGIFLFETFRETFRCYPVQAQWDSNIPDHHCVTGSSFRVASYVLSIVTILSDWLYALIPIPMIWSVNMTKQTKVTVAGILSLGIFASIATLVRVKYLAGIENLNDILFSGTNAMTWSLVEPGTAIIGASLATIRPLLRAMNIRGFETNSDTRQINSAGPAGNPSARPPNHIPFASRGQSGGKNNTCQERISWPLVPIIKGRMAARIEELGDDGPSEDFIFQGPRAECTSFVGSQSKSYV